MFVGNLKGKIIYEGSMCLPVAIAPKALNNSFRNLN